MRLTCSKQKHIVYSNTGTRHSSPTQQSTLGLLSGYKIKRKSCIEQGNLGILITWITPHCKYKKGELPIQIGHAIDIFFLPTTVTVEPCLTDTPQPQTPMIYLLTLITTLFQW